MFVPPGCWEADSQYWLVRQALPLSWLLLRAWPCVTHSNSFNPDNDLLGEALLLCSLMGTDCPSSLSPQGVELAVEPLLPASESK